MRMQPRYALATTADQCQITVSLPGITSAAKIDLDMTSEGVTLEAGVFSLEAKKTARSVRKREKRPDPEEAPAQRLPAVGGAFPRGRG